MTRCSIILPVHNEGKVLKDNVEGLERVLSGNIRDFEIIISEDGSTDDTVRVAKALESERVRLLHNTERMGKGAAIMNAASASRGETIIFMDADLASNPTHVKQLLDMIDNGAAIVIGSRYLKGSKVRRSMMRHLASRCFNWLVRIVLGSRLSDHQCGFKAFRKEPVLPIINEVEDKGWFWDTEFLVRAQRRKLRIEQIPIEWEEGQDTKFRLVRDAMKMGWSLLRFRLKG